MDTTNFALYRHLTLLRLRWYAAATGRVLVRHWQLFVLAGMFVPMGTPLGQLLKGLAYPLMAALQPGHGVTWHGWRIVLIQALALTWVMVQRRHIGGGAFVAYVTSLPIPAGLHRWVDLSVLLPANSLLLAPMIALIILAPSGAFGTSNLAFLLATAGVLAVLVLLTQLAALHHHTVAMVPLALADGLLSWGLSGPVDAASWLALGAALLTGSAWLACPPAVLVRLQTWMRRTPSRLAPNDRRILQFLPPAWRIQVQALWVLQPVAATLRLASALALALAAAGLMQVFGFDARALPTAILGMAAIALVSSGLYRLLQATHNPMQPYLHALPLPRRFWALQDTVFVITFGALPLAVVLAPLGLSHAVSIVALLILALAYFALLALLRLPLVHGWRQAMLQGVILTGAWAGTAMAAVVR